MLMKVSIPTESGNRSVVDGSLPKTVMGFLEQHKPEASYFITENGQRTALFFFDMKDSTSMPMLAEPFFQSLGAGITWCPAMNPADLKSGLERLPR
jgi:hypothetical protein